ncbi:MAG: hypothetical protein C4313_04965 [Thermoflexus sp.]|mgnify:CR=1 FL=1|uniref:hypothetical protein n=1 Tax=Thermoflexus sp. TaxID=1969742 RepID=UPI003332DE09
MAWRGWIAARPEGPAPPGPRPAEEIEAQRRGTPQSPLDFGGTPKRTVSLLALGVGLMMAGGWLALEWFNYAASQYALAVLFGNLMADGLSWATLLALGLWLMDLSGLLYLSIPDERGKPGFWYVLVAWLLASGANALLKWWAVAWALMASPMAGAQRAAPLLALTPYIPTAVAFVVWTGRVLLVSTLMGLWRPFLGRMVDQVRAWAAGQVEEAAKGPAASEPARPRLITPEEVERAREEAARRTAR